MMVWVAVVSDGIGYYNGNPGPFAVARLVTAWWILDFETYSVLPQQTSMASWTRSSLQALAVGHDTLH